MQEPTEQVFVVLHVSRTGWGEAKLVGVYRTEDRALKAIEVWAAKPGFDADPLLNPPGTSGKPGFYLGRYTLDEGRFEEGFELIDVEDTL